MVTGEMGRQLVISYNKHNPKSDCYSYAYLKISKKSKGKPSKMDLPSRI